MTAVIFFYDFYFIQVCVLLVRINFIDPSRPITFVGEAVVRAVSEVMWCVQILPSWHSWGYHGAHGVQSGAEIYHERLEVHMRTVSRDHGSG